jgi:7-cyano-7-deazaguanine synthase
MTTLTFPDADSAVLFSGGLDSTVLLHLVKSQVKKSRVAAFYQDFGQESATRQRAYVQATCNDLGVPLHVLDAPRLVNTVLGTQGPPHIMQTEYAAGGVHIMGSVGGKFFVIIIALRLGFTHVYHGLTATDAARWPNVDQIARLKAENAHMNSACEKPFAVSSEPFLENGITDEEVVRIGASLGLDLVNTWSCLWGNRFHCGQCSSCQKRKIVFKKLKIKDQTQYLSTQQDFTTNFLVPPAKSGAKSKAKR